MNLTIQDYYLVAIRATFGAGICLLSTLPAPCEDGQGTIPRAAPPQAVAQHYLVQTFSSSFGTEEIDITGGARPGLKWYPWKFFGSLTNTSNIRINLDDSVTLLGDVTGPNGQLATVSPAGNASGFVGKAFGGGGYFEATFKFDPADVLRTNFKGWPSWWSMAVEHMLSLEGRQWPGQEAGYEHFAEIDIFEYDLEDYVRRGNWNVFGGAVHDWYGLPGERYKDVSPRRFAITRSVPVDTDFTQYHRYGLLWVPATPSRRGYLEYYFDDMKIGWADQWEQLRNQAPPPKPPWAFGIVDNNHLVLILGTGVGQPMTVSSVHVWQASEDGNMAH